MRRKIPLVRSSISESEQRSTATSDIVPSDITSIKPIYHESKSTEEGEETNIDPHDRVSKKMKYD